MVSPEWGVNRPCSSAYRWCLEMHVERKRYEYRLYHVQGDSVLRAATSSIEELKIISDKSTQINTLQMTVFFYLGFC